jgi:hypothetical protein
LENVMLVLTHANQPAFTPMKKPIRISTTCLVLSLLSLASASAAVIVNASPVANQPNWFTAGFGDVGYSFFGGGADTKTQVLRGGVLDTGGSVSIAVNAVNSNGAQASSIALQNPLGGTFTNGAWYTSGLTSTSDPVNVFTLTFGSGSPSSARIGILVGATEFQAAAPLDYPATLSLAGTGATTQTQTVTVPGTRTADWYFFDVTGIVAGNTFTLAASRIGDVADHRFNPVNGVAISVIPEPSSIAMLLGGVGALALLRRRR